VDSVKLDAKSSNDPTAPTAHQPSVALHSDQRHVDSSTADETLSSMRAFESSNAPFEFVVVETVLAHCMARLSEEFAAIAAEIEGHLAAIEGIMHWERLRVLLVCRKKLTLFGERVTGIRECLKSVLDSDADMADMYLSDVTDSADGLATGQNTRPDDAHEEVELMLEAYLRTAEELASRTQVLSSHMASTEDIVNIGLVGQRNALLMLDLRLSIGTFAASMGGFGASMLGMNLHNGFEHAAYAFWVVLAALCSVTGAAFVATYRRLSHLIRMF
jgi:Mg2+ and Co2+ transporter CorA